MRLSQLFCSSSQCAEQCCDGNDVGGVPCCGEEDSILQLDTETELPSEEIENFPILIQPAVFRGTKGSFPGSVGTHMPWAIDKPEQQVEAPAGKRLGVAPSQTRSVSPDTPRVNPLSSVGFITATFTASSYIADAADAVDVGLASCLKALDAEEARTLALRRLAAGRYEIDGRLVSICRGCQGNNTELFAREEPDLYKFATSGSRRGEPLEPGFISLLQYLQQAASIALQVRHPKALRTLTFPDAGSAVDDRYVCMQLACEQARILEEATKPYRAATTAPAVAPVSIDSLSALRPLPTPSVQANSHQAVR